MSAAGDLITALQSYAVNAFNKSDVLASGLNTASFANQPLVFARPLTQYQTIPTPSVPVVPPAPTAAQLAVNFDAALVQVKGVVDSLQDSWLMTYFPAAMPTGFDPLMAQILDGTIITEAMQELLWERAKQQGLRDAARFEDTMVSQWASRGFSMPGGVLNNQLIMKGQELLHMNAGFAAQQAIKALDIQVEQTKFAAQIGTQLRLGLINGLAQLVDAYARLPQAAADYAAAVARAQQAAYLAIADYYRMIISSSELSLRANIANADNDMKYVATAGAFIGSVIRSNVDAQVAAVNTYAQAAAAAVSGLTGVATVASTT